MDREQILQILKDSLDIQVFAKYESDWGDCPRIVVEVSLKVGDEVIATDESTAYL